MPKTIPLLPVTGLVSVTSPPTPGSAPVQVRVKMFVEILEPGDPPFKRPRTLGDLKRIYRWDAGTSTLRIPHTDRDFFVLGPDVLDGLADSTPMRLQVMYGPGVLP